MSFREAQAATFDHFIGLLSPYGTCIDVKDYKKYEADDLIILISKLQYKRCCVKWSKDGRQKSEVLHIFGKALTPRDSSSITVKLSIIGELAQNATLRACKKKYIIAILKPVVWFPVSDVAHVMVNNEETILWLCTHINEKKNNFFLKRPPKRPLALREEPSSSQKHTRIKTHERHPLPPTHVSLPHHSSREEEMPGCSTMQPSYKRRQMESSASMKRCPHCNFSIPLFEEVRPKMRSVAVQSGLVQHDMACQTVSHQMVICEFLSCNACRRNVSDMSINLR